MKEKTKSGDSMMRLCMRIGELSAAREMKQWASRRDWGIMGPVVMMMLRGLSSGEKVQRPINRFYPKKGKG